MMHSSPESSMNIADLANQLRKEKIFINSERELLQNLNEEVEKSFLELLQVAWICSQQRLNLNNIITSRSEVDSVAACQKASLLDFTNFVDVYKVLRYKEASSLGELFGWLRDSPHLIALCLLLGEEHIPSDLPASLVAGLYGSCRSANDRTRLLSVLRSLIKHQLAPSNDPRKLLRSGKCAFYQLYSVFRDGHTPARQFLYAALQGPVMSVLQDDDFFLDIDPDKAMERFSPSDRVKKFGHPNSQDYITKVGRYRKWTVKCLYNLTIKFINSLKENWNNFPATISWIVQQIVLLLKQHSKVPVREINAICTDLIFNQFICPAIINPEAHGIIEVPVSYVARFNLIQVAQIIQMLCLAKYQEVDPKLRDLYNKFDRSSVWLLIDGVCSGMSQALDTRVPTEHSVLQTEPLTTTTVAMFTREQLASIISFLKRVSLKLNNNTPSVTSEEYSSGSGPLEYGEGATKDTHSASTSDAGSTSTEDGYTASLAAMLQNIEPNYRSRLHDLLRKMPDFTKRILSENKETDYQSHKRSILSKVSKPRLPRSMSSNSALASTSQSVEEKPPVNGDGAPEQHQENLEVLVIKLANVGVNDYVGLIPESKFLEFYDNESEPGVGEEAASTLAVVGAGPPVQKRARFSVSHDEVSLGNASDNLEAVSEAASNHSVTSSIEMETEDQNDNLSDMVSANVSGRGSPNVSGRETPSSQVTDGDGAPSDPLPSRRPQNAAGNQGGAQGKMKQTRSDIEDKFCKFEIKKLLEGDETVSVMSDTWSTDVLASDSETIGDSCEQTQVSTHLGGAGAINNNAPDVSETASESAWSVDVLASDSDKNTEVDTDDCVSVAARSDTSWPRRPSHHDDVLPRKMQHQNGSSKKRDVDSPKHSTKTVSHHRGNGGYLSATAYLSRGAELDLHAANLQIQNRKSILVNGYPMMTCYATSAPESPSTSAPALPNDVFDFGQSESNDVATESTLEEATGNSDATSQWVDDSFPPPHLSPSADYGLPSTSNYTPKSYDMPSTSKAYDHEHDPMDLSLNSSESSFNALSVSQYDRAHFDSGIETEHNERSTISDLMSRMSTATISTSNLVNNLNRIVKSEIRTSIVNISSSRIERNKPGASNISLSTLSVNSAETSVSDKSSSQDVNSENVTERRVSPPPQKVVSTGAIPKSISFDSTAEKAQRRRLVGEENSLVNNLDELKNNVKRSGGNFLHKIKMFRQKGRGHQHEIKLPEEEQPSDDGSLKPENNETSEDILAKYRRKSSNDSLRGRRCSRRPSDTPPVDPDLDRCEGVIDLDDPEMFNNMKRKLRMVLSNSELHCAEFVPNRNSSASLIEWVLAAACSASSEASAARASELARALTTSVSGSSHTGRLATALRRDMANRRPYVAYLADCRAGLTNRLHALNRQISIIRTECSKCASSAVAARVLELLEKSNSLRRLARHHHPNNNYNIHNGNGEPMDEKASRLTASIKATIAEIKMDPSWDGASEELLEVVEVTVERAAFARMYLHVLFPNGDGDIARDQLFYEHMRRLSSSVSAANVGIAARHVWAAPYSRAQRPLTHLPVYKTPRDKLMCITRCVQCVMAILGLSDAAPSADDLTPVLVYIILRVNPPSVLSTIELVNILGGSALQGEALYCWTLFSSAIAYIKTMDYPRPQEDT